MEGKRLCVQRRSMEAIEDSAAARGLLLLDIDDMEQEWLERRRRKILSPERRKNGTGCGGAALTDHAHNSTRPFSGAM